MWKRDEASPEPPRTSNEPRSGPDSPRRSSTSEPATIGPSITIKGEVSGDEDLLIQGKVEGLVDLEEQSVTVGRQGEVEADITGRVVTVEGTVTGDLNGGEQVILRASARVQGDITSPRVVLEDGANFRGLVDMGPPQESRQRKGGSAPGTKASSDSTTGPDTGSPPGSSSSGTTGKDGDEKGGSPSSGKADDKGEKAKGVSAKATA